MGYLDRCGWVLQHFYQIYGYSSCRSGIVLSSFVVIWSICVYIWSGWGGSEYSGKQVGKSVEEYEVLNILMVSHPHVKTLSSGSYTLDNSSSCLYQLCIHNEARSVVKVWWVPESAKIWFLIEKTSATTTVTQIMTINLRLYKNMIIYSG